MATLLAVHLGFRVVVLLAIALYAVAAAAVSTLEPSRASVVGAGDPDRFWKGD
jgi:hypothetical protein